MSRKTASTEPWNQFCPEGCRFIFQAVVAKSEEEAVAEVRRLFGRTDAVALPGCFRLKRNLNREEWHWCPGEGYMCFVPVNISLDKKP